MFHPSVTPVEAFARPCVCVCVCVCRHHDCAHVLRPRGVEVGRTLEFRACVCLCVRALSIFQSFPPPSFSRRILRAVPSSSSVIQLRAVPCPPLRGCRRGLPRVYFGGVVRGDVEATLSCSSGASAMCASAFQAEFSVVAPPAAFGEPRVLARFERPCICAVMPL